VGDSLVRDLAAARREPAVHRIEPEQKSEPELRRATPPGQLLQLITGQRPVPDQLIFIQHTRHETSGSPASTAATHPPQTQRIRINTGRARSTTSRDPPRILSQPAGVVPDLGQRNPVYLVTAVLPTPRDEEAAAVAELRELAGGRADLLAEVAGIFEGHERRRAG